jgi:alkylated DNA repair dioxygenase AlkB
LSALSVAAPVVPSIDAALGARLAALDQARVREVFREQDQFCLVEDFLPAGLQKQLLAATRAARREVNRNYLPGHKKGGSVSRHTIDRLAPFIAELYRSPVLKSWLESLCGEQLLPAPQADPHAYALYFYTEPGDHIGWHYDTSYYKGRRYTVLLGVVDESSSKLAYRLYTRKPQRQPVENAVALQPGALVFFDGDRLLHRVTPLGPNEERIALTLEYVTDPRMGAWQRLISNWKDAVAYFGLRQVFGRRRRRP